MNNKPPSYIQAPLHFSAGAFSPMSDPFLGGFQQDQLWILCRMLAASLSLLETRGVGQSLGFYLGRK